MDTIPPRQTPEPLTGDRRRAVVAALARLIVAALRDQQNCPPAPTTRDEAA